MPRKTIYLSEDEAKIWAQASRVIRYNHSVGLGKFLTPHLKQVLLWEPKPTKCGKPTTKKH